MAVDEAMLAVFGSGGTLRPTLRLYGWEEPTLSIGYLQRTSDFEAAALPLVRRITGGRAVLHHREVTYAVVAGAKSGPLAGGISAAYEAVSRALVEALRGLGVDARWARPQRGGTVVPRACFHAPNRFEVLARGRKIAGSAQRRSGAVFLQHGSILVSMERDLNERVFGAALLEKMTSVEDETGAGDEEALREGLVEAFARTLSVDFQEAGLTEDERELASALEASRYSTREWNLGGDAAPKEALINYPEGTFL